MPNTDVNAKLKQFITEQFLDGDDSELDDDTPLLEWGVIDSVGMFALLEFINKQLDVQVPDAEVSPRNFQSIAVLEALVLRLQAEQGGGADA